MSKTATKMTAHEIAMALHNLRCAWSDHFTALIAKYPAQAANHDYYARKQNAARLGRVTRKVVTKGRLSVYERGELVLVWDGHPESSFPFEIFGKASTCCTAVNAATVEVLS